MRRNLIFFIVAYPELVEPKSYSCLNWLPLISSILEIVIFLFNKFNFSYFLLIWISQKDKIQNLYFLFLKVPVTLNGRSLMGDETGKKFSLQLYTSHQEIISPAFFYYVLLPVLIHWSNPRSWPNITATGRLSAYSNHCTWRSQDSQKAQAIIQSLPNQYL